jgi:hypothetical protein
MTDLPVDRALSIYGALANRSETKGARERLSKHLMQRFINGEKRRTSLDGPWAHLSARHGSGVRFPQLTSQSLPLFPQRASPRYFGLRDTDAIGPCVFLRWVWCRLLIPYRWQHRQSWCWDDRGRPHRLRFHRASDGLLVRHIR